MSRRNIDKNAQVSYLNSDDIFVAEGWAVLYSDWNGAHQSQSPLLDAASSADTGVAGAAGAAAGGGVGGGRNPLPSSARTIRAVNSES